MTVHVEKLELKTSIIRDYTVQTMQLEQIHSDTSSQIFRDTEPAYQKALTAPPPPLLPAPSLAIEDDPSLDSLSKRLLAITRNE